MDLDQCTTPADDARACERGVHFVGTTLRLDAPAAEELLFVLARKLGRPMPEVAEDVRSGHPFPGRPSWL